MKRTFTSIKLIIAGVAWAADVPAQLAQPPPPSQVQESIMQPWHVHARDAHLNVWESVTEIPGPKGRMVQRTKRFVELAAGLNFRDAQGEWQPAEARFEITENGVQALRTAHKVRLPADIATSFGVEVVTPAPEELKLRSFPLAVGYYDPVDGRSIVLATLTNATGWLVAEDRVVYSNCFVGVIEASLSYHLTRAGLAQDLLLAEAPPPPQDYGLSEHSRLELMTEFEPGAPLATQGTHVLEQEEQPALRQQMVEPDFSDVTLSIGSMQMAPGIAFLSDPTTLDRPRDAAASAAPVGKRMIVIDGRRIVIEAVGYRHIQSMLEKLPPARNRQAALPLKNSEASRTAMAQNSVRSLPPRPAAVHTQSKVRTASIAPPDTLALVAAARPVLVLDYDLQGTFSDFAFSGDTN